jgi:hypothetical protein
MNPAIETLVAKWAEPGGIPFKGYLISADGCMCAQGQALHYVGGWSPERLRKITQSFADQQTARLLGISVAHAILLRLVNDHKPGAPAVVLTDPAQVLGDQAETVLAFWRHLDRMTVWQWDALRTGTPRFRDPEHEARRAVAHDAAFDAVGCDAAGDAWQAAAARSAIEMAGRSPGEATNEIQGARILRERGQPFTFLPMFGFADPEAILAKEADQ